jgi:hypothetical protein
MPNQIRLYESAMLKMYQQVLFFEDLLNESEEPTAEEIAGALLVLHKARKRALQAWEGIPPDRRDGVPGPPPGQ